MGLLLKSLIEFQTRDQCDASPTVTFHAIKLAFHDADTDTDTDVLADILARIVARMSACRVACHRNNLSKIARVVYLSARILARMSVSVSASWNSSLAALLLPLMPCGRASAAAADKQTHRPLCAQHLWQSVTSMH